MYFWHCFLFLEKMKLEAETFLKKSKEAAPISENKSRELVVEKASGWDDGVREKTEWSTDSEDEVISNFSKMADFCFEVSG